MAIKLHRCPLTFLHTDHDACWRVQHALDEQGIAYEVVKAPLLPKSRRDGRRAAVRPAPAAR